MSISWCVYIVRCADDSLYTGIATDVQRRTAEHNHDDALAAKYTRVRRPEELVYQEACARRAEAARREHAIKRLSRREKLALIELRNMRLATVTAASSDLSFKLPHQLPQHFLYFFPLPHGQGSVRPTLDPSLRTVPGVISLPAA